MRLVNVRRLPPRSGSLGLPRVRTQVLLRVKRPVVQLSKRVSTPPIARGACVLPGSLIVLPTSENSPWRLLLTRLTFAR